MMVSFNPAEAAVSVSAGQLPDSVRTVVFDRGTIGNTSFVAIPYNAANKEGAMVVADFLLEPATQAYAQDFHQMGNFTVLDFAKLSPAERKRFDELPKSPALPTNAELGTIAARAASVVDDAHRGRMGAAVHEVSVPRAARRAALGAGAHRRAFSAADRRGTDRHAAAGVRLPARDRWPIRSVSMAVAEARRVSRLRHERHADACPPAFATSVLAVAVAVGFCAFAYDRPWMRRLGAMLAPVLSTPHSAIAHRPRVPDRAVGVDRARAVAVAHRLDAAAGRRHRRRSARASRSCSACC